MNETQKALFEATMKIVADSGLEQFSMRQVTGEVGVSSAVIYKYFENKEKLLYECFLSVNKQIADLFQGLKVPLMLTEKSIIQFVHDQWVRYFKFMVENDYRTMFYYAYRESSHLQEILMRNNEETARDFSGFMDIFQKFADKVGLFDRINPDYFWAFLLEGTGIYVKHIIRDGIAYTEEDIEMIWKLLTGGLLGVIRK